VLTSVSTVAVATEEVKRQIPAPPIVIALIAFAVLIILLIITTRFDPDR
jgi:hypothetical protein